MSRFDPSQVTPELTLAFLQTSEVSVAKLVLARDDWQFESTGDSKKHPTDDVDLVVGHDLALARALVGLALQLLDQHDVEVLSA